MRKLVVSSTVVFMLVSLALASGASAMLISDPSGGSVKTQPPVTSTPGSFPWGAVALGVALAAIAAVCLGAALYLSRNRQRLAALHS